MANSVDLYEVWRTALERCAMAAALFGPADAVVWANDAALRLTGLSRDDVGDTPLDALELAPQTVAAARALLRDARSRGRVERELVVEGPGRPRQVFWVEATAGTEGFVATLALDRTAERRAAHERRQLGQRLHALLERSGNMVAAYGPDHRLVLMNAIAREHLGPDAVGRSLHDLFQPEEATLFARRLEHVFATAEALAQDDAVEIDGRRRWFRTQVLPEVDPDRGEVASAFVIARDVTPQIEAEAASREAARRLERVLRKVGATVTVLDAEGRVLAAAHAHDRVGEPAGPMLCEEVARAAERVFASGAPVELDTCVEDPSGARWVRSALYAERDGDGPEGEVLSVTVIQRDVTELRELEAQLLHAERVSALGAIAASLSHELRNPLAAICANLESLGALEDPQERAQVLEDSRAAAERLGQTLRSVSVFIGGGEEARDEPEPASVAACVQRVRRLLDNELRHRCEVEVDVHPEHGVRMPPGRLIQLLTHLTVNALQAFDVDAPASACRLTFRARREGERLRLGVEDTGPGMSPEVLARAGSPFFTTKALGEGSGLGLAVCRRIAEQAGGSLRIDSALGRGTLVELDLPASEERAGPLTIPPPAPRRLRVMVVDDEPRVLRAIARLLRTDHEVVACGSGEEALARLEAGERFDVVLSDHMMPSMDGEALAGEIAARFPELADRVGFLTGGAFGDRGTAFLDRNVERTLYKPCSKAQLLDLVARLSAG